jgi:hypothetical protein
LTAARSYIAGIGASGALVGATVLAVVLLGALLAFEGFPIAGDDGSADSIRVGAGENSIGVATAAAVGAAPGAVAAAPAAAAGGAAAGGGADAGAPGTAPPGTTGTDGSVPPGTPSPTDPTAPPTGAPPAPPGVPANPITDTLSGVDSAVEAETGINPNLGGATEPVTGAVDQVLEDTTGNDLGGHVDNVTDGLPGD